MLRFLSERRAWVVAVCVALLLVIGLWVWGAGHVTSRATELIRDRFGVEADITEAKFALNGVHLRGVEIRGQAGGFEVRADEVNARVTLLGALLRGARAVRAVSARGVEVDVDLGDAGLNESLERLRGSLAPRRQSSKRSASTKGGGRRYAVIDLTVRVRDADGSLVAMNGVNLHKGSDGARCSVAETLLGEERGDHARVGETTLGLQREAGVWAVRELRVEEGSVRWLGDAGGALAGGRDDAGALAGGRDDAARKPLALRIRQGLEALRASEPPTQQEDADAEPTDSGRGARLLARVTPDVDIRLSSLDIESRTPQGHVERVRDLEMILTGEGDGWYRLLVGGETSNNGRMNVDLRLMPREARGEGTLIARGISMALVAPFVPQIPFYNTEVGTVSAELVLRADSPDQVRIEGGVRLREVALASERIAPEPVEGINLDAGGEGVWFPAQRRLLIESGQVQLGKARLLIDGELERTAEHYRVDLTAKLPPTECNDVVSAIPSDVLGSLRGFSWSGNWAAVATITLDSRDLEATELGIRMRNLCQFERVPRWVSVERFQEPFRHVVVEPDESTFEMQTGPGTDNWVPLAEVSPFLIQAVIGHEDARFYDHAGFAPWAIRDALVRNLREGGYVVGASTISMQLAKNLYLRREKTIARKVQEVILTWWLENALNKDEILELYLNVIEYGPSIYGLKNGSMHYFGRQPSELSPAESAFLACILPSPKRFHMVYERDTLTRSIQGRMRRLLEHMAKRERIGEEALRYGLAEIENFQFHQDGDPPPVPRVLPPLGVQEPEPEDLDPFEALFVAP